MARLPLREIRRMGLEKAAFDAASELGFRGFVLAEVARRAGTVKGTVHHYFVSKEELVESAIRYANREFSKAALHIIRAAKSPSERLWGILALNLDPEFFNAHVSRTYVSVLASGIRYKGVLRIYDATHPRIVSNLVFALRHLINPEDARPLAHTLMNIVDGAWLLQATQDKNIAKPTLRILAHYLKTAVPGFESSVIRDIDAFPERSPSNT
jgi:TetR/AcrR family transcriptional regulator, transcriptional repressor of bet genes